MKLCKEKASYYSNQQREKQNLCKLWKTLNELLPNKKQHKTVNAPASENLTAVQNFVLQKVSTNFVLKELSKLKVTKALGPDGITA